MQDKGKFQGNNQNNRKISKTDHRQNFFILLFFGICSVFTVLFAVTNALDLSYSVWKMCLYLSAVAFLVCVLKVRFQRRIFWLYLLTLAAAFWWRESLWWQGTRVVNGVLADLTRVWQFPEGMYILKSVPEDTVQLTALVMTAFLIFFYQLLFLKKGRLFTIGILFFFTISGSLLGHEVSVELILLFVLSTIGIFLSDKKYISGFRIFPILILLTAGLGICYLAASESVLDRSTRIVQNLSAQLSARILPPLSSAGASRNVVSRGNRVNSDKVRMVVTLDKKPTVALYLKGFTGTDYDGKAWSTTDEHAFVWQAQTDKTLSGQAESETLKDPREKFSLLGNKASGYLDSWIWYRAFDQMRREKNRVHDGYEPLHCQIENRKNDAYEYRPYFSRSYGTKSGAYLVYADREYERLQRQSGHGIYEDEQDFLDRYQAYVADIYQSVPEDRIPELKKFCEEHPLDWDVTQIQKFVRDTLWKQTSYTLSPGNVPAGKDTVDYFLFDNRKGYCVHYATTAVLMYRLYGLSARYASGYMIQPEQFKRQSDGTYQAVVRESDSHAWAEIYQEKTGWYPVEVTPADTQAQRSSSAGRDSAGTDQNENNSDKNNPNENVSDTDNSDTNHSHKNKSSQDSDTDRTAGADSSQNKQQKEQTKTQIKKKKNIPDLPLSEVLLLKIAAVAGILCLLIIVGRWIAGRIYLWRLKRMDVRQIFTRFLRLLHKRFDLKDYQGQETDFAKCFCEKVPVILPEEAEEMCRIVQRAAFSAHTVSETETAKVRELYLRARKYARKKRSFSGILSAGSRQSS